MKLSAYSYTNPGGRPYNEDRLGLRYEGGRGVFALADGLGGHACGEVAAALAVETLCGASLDPVPDQAGLLDRLQAANTRILDGQTQAGQGDMRTTAVTLSLDGPRACWAYIGDSRLYHLSGGRVTRLTQDHSVTYRKYLGGEISYLDVYHDDDRSSLLRVLGKPTCLPEGGQLEAAPGDAFLLCSDGFWEFVYDEEILTDWLKASDPELWAQSMLLRHIRRTPPGNDNFSLIAVFVEEET